ncbi:hypothetical protein QP028_02560 [Corynebacterium suedekumii]|nr:hypothetical protein QP028_02560 [Corynebacterium suedekumii]
MTMTADNVLDGVAKDLLDAYRTGDPIAPPRGDRRRARPRRRIPDPAAPGAGASVTPATRSSAARSV